MSLTSFVKTPQHHGVYQLNDFLNILLRTQNLVVQLCVVVFLNTILNLFSTQRVFDFSDFTQKIPVFGGNFDDRSKFLSL